MLHAVNNDKLRILVVDDQHSILLTYMLILQQQGHEVIGADSWARAEEQLTRDRFDVLLCDLSLDGGHSGFEVIDCAQMRDPHIASVLLTGYGAPEVEHAAEQRGVAVLYKPVPVEELLHTLTTVSCATGAA